MSLLIPGDQMPTAGPTGVPWLIQPYIPREGVIFLYGKKGVGKSPLTWSLAHSVASGEPWLGLPVQNTGTVLYIEVDSPLSVVKVRTDHMRFTPQTLFYFPTDPLLCLPEGYAQLKRETEQVSPALVIVNTLRKIHSYSDKDSDTPARIYSKFRRLWPSILFVHHEKRTPANPDEAFEPGEEFSGSLAWHNDAQTCLHLRRATRSKEDGSHNLLLINTGNQLTALAPTLKLELGQDGYSLSPRT